MDEEFAVTLNSRQGYQFEIDFALPGVAPFVADTAAPLGTGAGPDSEKLLLAAVGNCLSASLLFALKKFHNDTVPIRSQATGKLVRNERGRLRVGSIAVDMHIGVAATELKMLDRALAQFEDFCVVTQSIRAAIPVAVKVFDSTGAQLAV